MDEAIDQVRAEYDAVPYASHAFPQSAPGHLAAIAHLFGLNVCDVAGSRALEIGCAAGGNLLPFATSHPDAQVVGIDLSQVQIEQGLRHVEALGIRNLQLLQGDIATIDLTGMGPFDFIICHGVYSWVPESAQEGILSAFQKLLSPDGIAYISYNVYPGWKAKEIVRDAMLLRGYGKETPEEKLGYARGMIEFLQQVAPADGILAKALADFNAIAERSREYYLLHEYLETFNKPCYFLEFLEHAGDYDLAYLADAAPMTMFAGNFGDKVADQLLAECGHSQVLLEQYLDFMVNRTFRQTLLVHSERASQIRYVVDPARFRQLHFAAWMPPAGEATQLDDSSQEFGDTPGATLVTQDPGTKATFEALNARWPWTLSYQELLTAVQTQLVEAGIEVTADLQTDIDNLLALLIARGQVRYRLDPVLPGTASTPPRIDEAARRMAELTSTDTDPFTFNRWHENIPLSPADRYVLPLLDGNHDREALLEALQSVDDWGVVEADGDDGQSEVRDPVVEYLDNLPQRLAAMKLAVASPWTSLEYPISTTGDAALNGEPAGATEESVRSGR